MASGHDALRDHDRVRVINESRGLVLAEHAEVAGSAWRRLRGLLGQPALNQGRGLIILPCLGVHSLGMGYRIDVVHVDRHNLVRAVLHGLRPWSIGPLVWKSHLALEVPAGVAATTLVGDRLAFEPPDRAGLSVYGDDGDLPRGPRGH